MTMRMNMNTSSILALVAATAFLTGCPDSASTNPAKTPSGETVKDGAGNAVSKAAADAFAGGLKAMADHDAANDWTDANCKSTADLFVKAAEEQNKDFFEAKYNAGVAYQRCKNDAEAKKLFESILSKKADFHRARVQVALYAYAANGDVASAISEMNRAIEDAKFKNEEALVNLAMLQMKRDSSEGGSGCDDDFSCAKLNLQRALAINDGFMPAFNQLAVYYLEVAKRRAAERAGKKRKKGAVAAGAAAPKADQQSLELAALVVSQALRKNPKYAPVHNTSGLISAELGDLSAAARAFGTARKLDKKFFEAHMNYAAVNLQFRGFQQAEAAYREAIKLKPNDFEAHLGLALAVRGQIAPGNWDKNVKETGELLAKAKKLSPERPETYYNEAILTQEFKAKAGGKAAETALKAAKDLFGQFVNKAEGKDGFTDAVTRAKERMEEIDQIIEFNRQSAEEQKRMESERRAREAKEQLEKSKKK